MAEETASGVRSGGTRGGGGDAHAAGPVPLGAGCPGCGYDLRGLVGAARFPECGSDYDQRSLSVHARLPTTSQIERRFLWTLVALVAYLVAAFIAPTMPPQAQSVVVLLGPPVILVYLVNPIVQVCLLSARFDRCLRADASVRERVETLRKRTFYIALGMYTIRSCCC